MKNKGLTIIELLIYLALVSLIAALATTAVYPMINSSSYYQSWVEIENEGNFIIKKIDWALSGFYLINQPSAGAVSSTLSINKSNFSDNPIVFNLSGDNLYLTIGAGDPIIINNENVKISAINFEHFIANGTSSAVGVELKIGHNKLSASTTIKTKFSLRN